MVKIVSSQIVVDRDRAHGGHFFDADTMRYWHSRLMQDAYTPEEITPDARLFRPCGSLTPGVFFVTSEHSYDHSRRLYTVRRSDYVTGAISTVEDFLTLPTRRAALRAARRAAENEERAIWAVAAQ